jgi:hypothetical protein
MRREPTRGRSGRPAETVQIKLDSSAARTKLIKWGLGGEFPKESLKFLKILLQGGEAFETDPGKEGNQQQ